MKNLAAAALIVTAGHQARAAEPPPVDPCSLNSFKLKPNSKFLCPVAYDAVRVTELLRLLDAEDELDLVVSELTTERNLRIADAKFAADTWALEHAARVACEETHAAPCVCTEPDVGFWEHPGFLGPVGFVLGVVATLAIIQVIE